ncbi:hypothetical protein LTR85_008383 [Meristemomyces frigidus]|nr:hypothetical protein LTR85_008383 [Meristemomyces frigidus]
MLYQPVPGTLDPYRRVAIAAQRKAAGKICIYHSCDPPGTKFLHSYKKGQYTPFTGFDADYPTEYVNIPKRYGARERVLRCAKGTDCLECILTEYEASDLSLSVAKAHGIRGAYIRPQEKAKTVEEKLKDAEERGKWMHRDPTAEELRDQTLRTPEFHEQAAEFGRVLRWLQVIPLQAELGNSTPLFVNNPEAIVSNETPLHVPGLGRGDTLGVGADFSNSKIHVQPKYQPRARPMRQAVAHAQRTSMPTSYVPVPVNQRHGAGAESNRPDTPYGLPANSHTAMPQQEKRAAALARGPSAAKAGLGPSQMLPPYHLPAAKPAGATAFRPVNEQSDMPAAAQYSSYGLPYTPAVQRFSEKRMLEDAGAVAQARRKRVKYGLEDMLHGI